MNRKLKNALASALAAVTAVTSVGCTVSENPDFDSSVYYQYDHSDEDSYQVIYVECKDGNIEPLLGKLYATPTSSILCYKKINTNEVIYEYDVETYTRKPYCKIVDIVPLEYLISEDSEIQSITTDKEALQVFNQYVLDETEKKLN